ncbi:MAG: OmpW family protein [Pseudomonadota bacterium]
MKALLLAAASAVAFTTLAAPAMAEQGDWLIRLRAITVSPDESADITPIGGDADISTSTVPELDITYFFSDNIAAELILGVTPHDVTAVGTALGDLDLGDVTLLPPTLTLQYHFNPTGEFRPYVGAGVNYTLFFNEDLPSGSPLTSIDYDPSFGFAAQAGFDYALNERWFLNVDLKKVLINTDVTIDAGALGTVQADVDIDPWIFGVGFGWRY